MGGRGNFSGGTFKTTDHKLSEKGTPNSRVIQYRNGKKTRERYYDDEGLAKWDIDYYHGANHKYPHKHTWDWTNPAHPERSEYFDEEKN